MSEIVSVIITILNGEQWIDQCFSSIIRQNIIVAGTIASPRPQFIATKNLPKIEICVFDDASSDNTGILLNNWELRFANKSIPMIIVTNKTGIPKGVGYGRNLAVKNSSGSYLCFQDIDDEMLPDRIYQQYLLAKLNKNAIIGSNFIRRPENSTCRFSKWANEISNEKLAVQIFTSNGPTIIMPTWFCHRNVFARVSGFSEEGKGTPEDLLFFYKHLDLGGKILRVNQILLIYRYHLEATTFSISKETIWRIRFEKLINDVLNDKWKNGFTIWNAGKQGRKFFRDLPDSIKCRVIAFCDVDRKKINKYYQYFDKTKRKITYKVLVQHFSKALTPILICMKLDLTNGVFEENLKSLNLIEGRDYVIFS